MSKLLFLSIVFQFWFFGILYLPFCTPSKRINYFWGKMKDTIFSFIPASKSLHASISEKTKSNPHILDRQHKIKVINGSSKFIVKCCLQFAVSNANGLTLLWCLYSKGKNIFKEICNH